MGQSTWAILDPLQDDEYSQISAISGFGDAEGFSQAYSLKVRIDGTVENSISEISDDVTEMWAETVPAPPPPDPDGWTRTDNQQFDAYFELWADGEEKGSVRVEIVE